MRDLSLTIFYVVFLIFNFVGLGLRISSIMEIQKFDGLDIGFIVFHILAFVISIYGLKTEIEGE